MLTATDSEWPSSGAYGMTGAAGGMGLLDYMGDQGPGPAPAPALPPSPAPSAPTPGPGTALPTTQRQLSIPAELTQRPEPGWGQIFGASLGGAPAIERLWDRTEAPWRGKVAQFLSRELLEGRPTWKPLHPMEIHGLVQRIDPRLNSDPKFQARMKYWADSWNRSAFATQAKMLQADAQQFQRTKSYGENLANYGGPVDPKMVPAMQNMGYGGLLGPGPDQAAPGGVQNMTKHPIAHFPQAMGYGGLLGPAPGQTVQGEVQTMTKHPTARSLYYVDPRSKRETAAAVAQERALGPVRTANEVSKRQALNQVPTARWAEQTNRQTGNKNLQWTGGLLSMDLGRKPKTTAELAADQARQAVTSGHKPPAGTVEADLYNKAMNPDAALVLMERAAKEHPGMFNLGGGGQRPTAAQPQSKVRELRPQGPGQKTVPYSRVLQTAKMERLSEGEVIKRLQKAGYSIDWDK